MQTGVWSIVESLAAGFMTPIRQVLSDTKTQSRSELKSKRDQKKMGRDGATARRREEEDPEVTVEIGSGGRLPEPSLQDEINVC